MLGRNRQGQVLSDFVNEKVEGIKKVDINIFKDDFVQDSYGTALLNVTKLWLLSSRWDRVRRPDWAGFFDKRLREYKMNDEGAKKVEADLKNAIRNKIPDVVITNVEAVPKLTERGWEVGVDAVDTSTDVTASMTSAEGRNRDFVSILNSDNITEIRYAQKETRIDEDGNTYEEKVYVKRE